MFGFRRRYSRFLISAVVFFSVVAVFAVALLSLTGGFHGAIAFLQGQRLVVEAMPYDLGDIEVGQVQKVVLNVRNLTFEELSIVGLETECSSCFLVRTELPVAIQSLSWKKTEISFPVPARYSGKSVIRFRLITDSPDDACLVNLNCDVHPVVPVLTTANTGRGGN